MATVPRFLDPPVWRNQGLVLYHGTLDLYVSSIRGGINPSLGNPLADFGRGFYTTTVLRQARAWAWQLAVDDNARTPPPVSVGSPVVIRFRVDRDAFASLQCLVFVRGDFDHHGYWSLVRYCRSGGVGHRRSVPTAGSPWYDVVAGPVAAFWRTRLAIANSDQFSFHTPAGVSVLDASPKRVLRVSTT